jgi:purine-binding chemotaxis protein CheW
MDDDRMEQASQFLSFTLNKEVYAIEITKVREVLDFTDITKVPKMPEFMRGVINLRGKVVPVIDLRLKFDMTATEKTVDTCIIIIEITLNNEMTMLGALADSVKEVMSLETGQIEEAPKIGTSLNTEFIKGMGKKNDEFIIILDIDWVFSGEELRAVQHVEKDTVKPEIEQ